MSKKALITGISGQDGSYLAELLLEKGYEVFGLVRDKDAKAENIESIKKNITLLEGDLRNKASIENAIKNAKPTEIYNFAAQSFVGKAWSDPVYTGEVNGIGVAAFLHAIKIHCPETKFFQASSSEMFGAVEESPQNEKTKFQPNNLYGAAKLYAHTILKAYREGHKLFAVGGIFYNHESPRRGMDFVTRKITSTAARIKLGKEKELRMGNMKAKRDWGFAKEYAEAAWLMLQSEKPNDYIIATGETHSVQEFVEIVFGYLDLDWEKYVVIDPKFFRPVEPGELCGDASLIQKDLGWQPTTPLKEWVEMMIENDLKIASRE
ncbi:MAG: GDP-mannose 4,6-dehydratase [Candidatus Harrisonbacteria bacterium CG10_big_fil_rev_8_21_14_0_10_42_17]|uniref:GDP-mannose 4,6-dehydratase n=1 Tax=Candidatus Harrisonbacteria bacterium CG10_big_fil_rev_8_21_14_0_10_42_17 TaxID=1974584 RepID=A0A2M6WI10_9BACT|nr:MAG: GDP-mannose 4,6-dehydratase [Candidatus Harrisonbacteria bacterium CG10_big_fil_rev_8_21_14_0_10_42_17]